MYGMQSTPKQYACWLSPLETGVWLPHVTLSGLCATWPNRLSRGCWNVVETQSKISCEEYCVLTCVVAMREDQDKNLLKHG